jgi:hypothetical protein
MERQKTRNERAEEMEVFLAKEEKAFR